MSLRKQIKSRKWNSFASKLQMRRIFWRGTIAVWAVDIHSHKLTTQYKITGPQLACLLAVMEAGHNEAARALKQTT
jgi:hypothetical protein